MHDPMRAEDYLDHAATSWPKPDGVLRAVTEWYTELGVSADRGESTSSELVRSRVHRTRELLGRRVGTEAERIAFTSGATESLHLLFEALLDDGDRVVTTATEHSSVVRPLRAGPFDLAVVRCDQDGRVDPGEVEAELRRSRSKLLVISHASNVTGAVQDITPMLAAARETSTISVLDASQTLGQIPVRIHSSDTEGPDLIVASAHKSLLGPPGLGLLAAARTFDRRIEPPKPGGSGSSVALDEHPRGWPQVFESGTPNTPAILGLEAALDWSSDRPDHRDRLLETLDRFADELREGCRSARIIRPNGPRLPVQSFVLPHMDPAEVGMLATGLGLHLRTGFHCAPWIHRELGTDDGGTVRVSLGPMQSGSRLSELAHVLAH